MKDTLPAVGHAEVRTAAVVADFVRLTKPRISLMVTLTGAVGYFMASRAGFHTAGFFHILVGTYLVAGAANTLNQILERTPDAQMRRTAERPLPTGRVSPEAAAWFAAILGIVGTGYTALFLNWLTALIAVATLASYAFVYTPLKRQTPWNTLVGAVPGALPPLGGWAAATGGLGLGGWVLFGVVFLWQIPHFLSIAWLLRQDYARAGFRMLPVVDPTGTRTARHLLVTGALLVPVSVLPALIGMAGTVYFVGALALSLLYLGVTIRLARRPETLTARAVFLVSLAYLPALLAILMIDKLPA